MRHSLDAQCMHVCSHKGTQECITNTVYWEMFESFYFDEFHKLKVPL